ncbi:hypothetical protein pb186bvf_005088 [Paramecium bursaria]
MKPVYSMIILFTLILLIASEPENPNENYEDQEDEAYFDYNYPYAQIIQQPFQNQQYPQVNHQQPVNEAQGNQQNQNANWNEIQNANNLQQEEEVPEEFCEYRLISNNTGQEFLEGFQDKGGNNTGFQN